MIIRGTTQEQYFAYPFSTSDISSIRITYSQNNKIIIDKNTNDIILDSLSDVAQVTLSQEETLSFKKPEKTNEDLILIQVRILLNNEQAYASTIMKERLMDILTDNTIE